MDAKSKGYELYKKGLSLAEISQKLNVPISTIKTWKRRHWANGSSGSVESKQMDSNKVKPESHETRNKGAPVGNQNAAGKGQAWANLMFRSLSPEDRQRIDDCPDDTDVATILVQELRLLTLREDKLLAQIETIQNAGDSTEQYERILTGVQQQKGQVLKYLDDIRNRRATNGIDVSQEPDPFSKSLFDLVGGFK